MLCIKMWIREYNRNYVEILHDEGSALITGCNIVLSWTLLELIFTEAVKFYQGGAQNDRFLIWYSRKTKLSKWES